MLSRVANLIYWTARYLERGENTLRLIDVNTQLVLDLESHSDFNDPRSWEPLVFVTGEEDKFFELYGKVANEEAVVNFLLFDRRNPSSLLSCIASARENARCIRDQISSEMWEALNTLYLRIKSHDYQTYTDIGATEYLNDLKLRTQQIYAVAESMMPRNEGWWFYLLGRYLERADNTSRILDIKYFMILPDRHHVGSALDVIQWGSVLRSCSGFEAFRRTQRGQLKLENVVNYLIRDSEFPRSILASVTAAENSLAKICQSKENPLQKSLNRELSILREHLENTDIKAIIASGLHEYLDDIQNRVGIVHAATQETFVNYDPREAVLV
ncbi:MAG: alpha-E domain-containing protein [Synoicihabitans sp.]